MTEKDTTIQEAASLHEKAVQAIARGDVAPIPKRVRKTRQKASEPVRYVKVDPLVWKTAQELLASPTNAYTSIEVVGPHEVVVR